MYRTCSGAAVAVLAASPATFGVFCTPPMAMPSACPHCGLACFLAIEDSQPACWGCGWRPRRKPTAAECGERDPLTGFSRRRGPSTGGVRL